MIQGVHLSFLAGNTTTLEHLQALLKQRDGELTHLQWELSRLQAERGVLDNEISNLTMEMETVSTSARCTNIVAINKNSLLLAVEGESAIIRGHGEML